MTETTPEAPGSPRGDSEQSECSSNHQMSGGFWGRLGDVLCVAVPVLLILLTVLYCSYQNEYHNVDIRFRPRVSSFLMKKVGF